MKAGAYKAPAFAIGEAEVTIGEKKKKDVPEHVILSPRKQREDVYMATEKKVTEILREAGYEPVEDRAIIVSYALVNMSEKIARFFHNEFFVLQICRESIVLVPFGKLLLDLKKEVALEIPFDSIKAVSVSEDMLNYSIELDTDEGIITLSAQQKELSEFRSSGTLATGMSGLNSGVSGAKFLKPENWHRKNLDATLEAMKGLKQLK